MFSDETEVESTGAQHVETRDDFPEDIIYQNPEFREILTDCISFFGEGRKVVSKLYDSIERSNPSVM